MCGVLVRLNILLWIYNDVIRMGPYIWYRIPFVIMLLSSCGMWLRLK